jgi:hypothetical protein
VFRPTDGQAVRAFLLPRGAPAAKRPRWVTALTRPAVALTLLVATVTVLVVVPTVLAAASSVLESTVRLVVEVAESR